MYEASLGLQKRPFASVPCTDQYFPAGAIEAARQTLGRCIQRGEGPAMLIGPSGTGKTLLCQLLAEQFRDFNVVLLSSGGLATRRSLFQAILYGLGRPYRGMDEGELRLTLNEFLTSDQCRPGGMLLLVDEAHTLPLRLLDEIRMLMNVVVGTQARVRLVLAGGPLLEERFASPKLASFSQRLAARCYLSAMNQTETENYLRQQAGWAGGNADRLFPADAAAAVFQATDGVPRLINQLCDHAMLLAYTAGKTAVDRGAIEEAWADLQQLPTPWNGEAKAPSTANAAAAVIEFGGLDEEPSTAGGPAPTTVAAEQRLETITEMVASLEDDFQPAGKIAPEIELVFDDPANPFSERFAEEEVVVDRQTAALIERRREEAARGTKENRIEPERKAPSPASARDEEEPRATVPLHEEAEPGPEIVVEDDGGEIQWRPQPPASPVRRHEFRQLFATLRKGKAIVG